MYKYKEKKFKKIEPMHSNCIIPKPPYNIWIIIFMNGLTNYYLLQVLMYKWMNGTQIL